MPCLEFRRVLFRSEEHTSELQSHSISYAVFCLKKKSVGSEEHTSELQSHSHLVCRLLIEKKTKQSEKERYSHGEQRRQTVRTRTNSPARARQRALHLVPALCLYEGHFTFFFFFNYAAPPGIFPFSPPRPFPY